MIHKSKLLNKYVTYLDKNCQYRTEKVIKISGKTLTVKNVLGRGRRIHPDKYKIFGRQNKKLIELIKWK